MLLFLNRYNYVVITDIIAIINVARDRFISNISLNTDEHICDCLNKIKIVKLEIS